MTSKTNLGRGLNDYRAENRGKSRTQHPLNERKPDAPSLQTTCSLHHSILIFGHFLPLHRLPLAFIKTFKSFFIFDSISNILFRRISTQLSKYYERIWFYDTHFGHTFETHINKRFQTAKIVFSSGWQSGVQTPDLPRSNLNLILTNNNNLLFYFVWFPASTCDIYFCCWRTRLKTGCGLTSIQFCVEIWKWK